jgi:C4-dicarboxylate-specific signal transduction histidine kinase
MASEGRLCQVFLNLLLHVARGIDQGQAEGNEIVMRSSVDQGQVCVELQDGQRQIPVEQLPRLFQPFYGSDDASAGAGLGLSISKSIVEDYGGTIHVESNATRGTCFKVM